jgi:hypothetical protein
MSNEFKLEWVDFRNVQCTKTFPTLERQVQFMIQEINTIDYWLEVTDINTALPMMQEALKAEAEKACK